MCEFEGFKNPRAKLSLETWTEESSTCASLKDSKTRGRSESEGVARRFLGGISPPLGSAPPAPPDTTAMVGGSESARGGTRKMVNYALTFTTRHF